jgi:hypothetical protein
MQFLICLFMEIRAIGGMAVHACEFRMKIRLYSSNRNNLLGQPRPTSTTVAVLAEPDRLADSQYTTETFPFAASHDCAALTRS